MNKSPILTIFKAKFSVLPGTCVRNKGTIHPFTEKNFTSSDLADNLTRNILYRKNGVIVFNKPQGISFSGENFTDNTTFKVSLGSLLPFLKPKLNVNELKPVKVPEKYASGVAVFCTDELTHNRIARKLAAMRVKKIPAEHYECVVIGSPGSQCGIFQGGITVETREHQKRIKLLKFEEFSKSQLLKGLVKSIYLEHEVLASSSLASLVKISSTRTNKHALRLYAASELVSPVLGDRVFAGLVKTVLGKPVLVDPWSPAAAQPTRLPKELLLKLELASREDIEIPLHLHLSKLVINDFPSQGKSLKLSAPPPEFFLWSCSKLNLNKIKPNEDEKNDSVEMSNMIS